MQNIILIGMMGTGKSSVGGVLADLLQWPLVDTDEVIEKEAGMSIRAIFETRGETFFRQLETRVLSEVLQSQQQQVVTTGGGSVLDSNNRKLMLETGTVVHLYATEEELIRRLEGNTTRPLLQGEVAAKVRKIRKEREGLYDFAHIHLNSTGWSVMDLAKNILVHLQGSDASSL